MSKYNVARDVLKVERADMRLMPTSLKRFYERLRNEGLSRKTSLWAVKKVAKQEKYRFPSED